MNKEKSRENLAGLHRERRQRSRKDCRPERVTVRDARWAVADAPDGNLVGMVGAVPLGEIGVLCHLAVHDGYRGFGLGALLSSWAVGYLRSRGAKMVRLYSTLPAEGLYRSLGFEEVTPRTVYRLE
jgi:GNAT superfamily N-acetyltransferase